MSDDEIIVQEEVEEKPRRKVGRPKGSKDKAPRKRTEVTVTLPISSTAATNVRMIGDERIAAFVNYHLEMLQMRQGVDKRNVKDLHERFYRYIAYCGEHCIMPNNMNAYFAIGVSRQDISAWKMGVMGTPEHKKFAEEVTQFFASIHEQAPTENLMNPISAMFWQKAHDGLIEAQKMEVVHSDPMGDRASKEDIAKRYEDVELPD